jgi:hypothetical protein
MIFATLANTSMIVAKLQTSLNNVQSQLKMENISSLAKDNKIKSLEELVLKIGYDPSNVKAAEEILKEKNVDIASMRKQLKILAIEDPQAKEMVETGDHKEEILKLIMEQNAQLKEMEAELENIVKEKEKNVPMDVIPLYAIPLIGVSTTTTTTTTTAEIPTKTLVTTRDASEKLAKSMEDMPLQGQEIKRLQDEINNLQQLKSTFQLSYNTEMYKSQRLKQELRNLQKETVMAKTLSEAKENIWIDICKSMTKIWPLIQIMFEKHELVQRSRQAIDKIRGELGERPTKANEIIIFLNSKTREELEALEIEDRTETILEVKKVLTKRGLMLQLEERSQAMDIGVQRFFSKIDSLHKKGLPGLFVINDKLITLSEYKQKIITVENDGSKFIGIQGSIASKPFLETL